MSNLVLIENVHSFDGRLQAVRLSAYANRAPLNRLCTAEMDAMIPAGLEYLPEFVEEFRNGRFPD